MTIERDSPTGTARYVPQAYQPQAPDVFGLARPPQVAPLRGPLSGPKITGPYPVGKEWPGLYYGAATFFDFGGGLNLQRGDLARGHNRLSQSTGDSRFEETFIHCQLSTEQTTIDPTSDTNYFLSSLMAFDVLVIAAFNSSESYLIKEGSDGALTQLTYAKGSGAGITSLANLNFGSTSYMAVGNFSLAVDLLTDVASTPTSAGTMHANSAVCWFMGQTTLPDTSILVKASTTLYSLPNTASIGDAMTARLTGLPQGGYSLGLASLGGGPLRFYFNMPRDNATPYHTLPGQGTSSAIVSTYRGRVYSVNQGGTDLQELRFPLNDVVHSALVRDGVVGSDGNRVIFQNGRFIKDLRIFANRVANSDRELKVMGFYIKDRQELYAEINEVASAGGTGNTKRWIEWYDWDNDCWHVAAYSISGNTLGTTGQQSYAAAGSLPVSAKTGYLHTRVRQGSSGSWWRVWQPPAGVNPHQYRKTSGATAASGRAFEPSAVATLPVLTIPGFEGCWFKPVYVTGPPIANIGFQDGTPTTPAKVSMSLGGVPITFNCTEPQSRIPRRAVNVPWTQTIQPIITSTQQAGGTDPTLSCPNSAGWTVEFFVKKEPLNIPPGWENPERAA